MDWLSPAHRTKQGLASIMLILPLPSESKASNNFLVSAVDSKSNPCDQNGIRSLQRYKYSTGYLTEFFVFKLTIPILIDCIECLAAG